MNRVSEKRLNLAVASAILVMSVWLFWAPRIWGSVGNLLLGSGAVILIWDLLGSKEPADFNEFPFMSVMGNEMLTDAPVPILGYLLIEKGFSQ